MRKRFRGQSGKYTPEVLRTAKDILRYVKLEESGCMVPLMPVPFGYIKAGVWYVQVEEITAAGTRKKKPALWTLYQHYYACCRLLKEGTGFKLRRECKTQGCMNYRHYELIQRNGNELQELLMAKEQIINLLTAALTQNETITFADESTAESFRMHIYRLRRDWKKNRVELYNRFEEVVIKKDKLHPNILEFTSYGRAFDDVLSRFSKAPETPTVYEPLSEEEQERFDEALIGKDRGKEVLKDLGYLDHRPEVGESGEINAGNIPLPSELSYDIVYAKATALSLYGTGEKLTQQEEDILAAGLRP